MNVSMLAFIKYNPTGSGGGCGDRVGEWGWNGPGHRPGTSWGTACMAASALVYSRLGIDALIRFGSGVACGQGTGQQWVNGHTTETVMMMSSSFSGLGTGVPGHVLVLSLLLLSPTMFGGCPVPFALVRVGGVVGGSKWWYVN